MNGLSSATSGANQSGSLFQGGNFIINNSQFTQHNQPIQTPTLVHNCSDADDGLKHLQAHVATTAFDSDQKVDAPKCHPNTRKAVLDDIMNWILQPDARVHWLLWLNGAAGAGKSAIARSIVELCIEQNIPLARFFFFRTDPTRNTIKPLVATLAHQLIQCISDLEAIIIPRIRFDSLIFTKSLETQFKQLIFEPLQQLQRDSISPPMVFLLIDGVDECTGNGNQVDLINILAKFVDTQTVPLIVFFGSRAENQLKEAFRSRSVSKLLLQIPLDDHYLPDADIRLFLDDSFATIKETHSYSYLLDPDWPAPALVQEIVDKSSGQFIYASVVIKFLATPNLHPAEQLDIVRGLLPTGALTPFAQLDALYRYIFSQVLNMSDTMYVLAAVILARIVGTVQFATVFRHLPRSKLTIPVLLANLTSVIRCEDGRIEFLHASLPDFLLDATRSREYHISSGAWGARLAVDVLHGKDGLYSPVLFSLLSKANPTAELKQSIMAYDAQIALGDGGNRKAVAIWIEYLDDVRNMNFGDNGETYRHQLRMVVRGPMTLDPKGLPDLQKKHDISPILEEIAQEKAAKAKANPSLKAKLKAKSKPWFKKLGLS